MKYVLLFVDTEQFANDLQAMGPAERERAYQQADKWFADHAGKLRGGSKLQAPETATTVRLDSAEPVITDGPFVEGKEVVSGYAEIEVADLDEALFHDHRNAAIARWSDVEQQVAEVVVLDDAAVEGDDEQPVAEPRHVTQDLAQVGQAEHRRR